jgi:hypothetical protein
MDKPSDTPLARKLGIRPGQTIAWIDAPPDWHVPDLPEPLTVRRQARGRLDLAVAFFTRQAALRRRLPGLTRAILDSGSLWIAWPRRAAGHESDITENGLREIVLPTGMVDVKVAALGEHWSGLKFVWRREHRGRR